MNSCHEEGVRDRIRA
eukprot:gene26932-biopygen17511